MVFFLPKTPGQILEVLLKRSTAESAIQPGFPADEERVLLSLKRAGMVRGDGEEEHAARGALLTEQGLWQAKSDKQ